MKILILSQYFRPETGAPQNRLSDLARRLHQMEGIQVDIFTAMPNYPVMEIHEEYKGKFFVKEELWGVKIFRSWIYASKSKGVFKRLLNYFSFVFSSMFYGLFKLGKYDVIFIESPPLFLGISGYFLAKVKRAKIIFNVADLWPESAEKLGIVTNKYLLGVATKLEEFMYRKSVLITGQAQGIITDIETRFPNKNLHWLPNGVDSEKLKPDLVSSTFREENGFKPTDKLFIYAGIIGFAQGLEIILKAAKKVNHPDVKFVLVGSGPVKEELLTMKEEMQLSNVYFFDAVGKKEIPAILKACDVALVPLRKLPLFEGIIPSKVFENMAMKIPVLLGVDGEARDLFITKGQAGWFYEPENVDDMVDKINHILLHPEEASQKGENGRKYVKECFERGVIAEKFANKLKEL